MLSSLRTFSKSEIAQQRMKIIKLYEILILMRNELGQSIHPQIVKLAELHHPDWNTSQIEGRASQVTDALQILTAELKHLPEDRGRNRAFNKAMRRFRAGFGL